jgi:ribulose-5-phosphate 4-epimerase/fuculose-1-phosphate aldolase
MSIPQPPRTDVSAEEWSVRVDLAAAYRLVALFGWDDLVYTHITVRVPGPDQHFLINPYGMLFDEITASNLVKIDLEGNKVGQSPSPINPAGFTIHSAIHAARHDIQCVLHTHTLDGVAVSAQEKGVLPISQSSIFVLNSLAYHEYEGLALREAEKPRLVNDLGTKSFLMLRNHGLLTVGRNVAEAFRNMYIFQRTCAVQVRAQAGGALIPIPQGLIDSAPEQAREVSIGMSPQMLIWPGLLRRLDRLDASFRT